GALGDSCELELTAGLVEELRSLKDGGEVDLITGAIHCACVAFGRARHMIRPGVTERELAAELDYRMMLAGADGPAFDTVVASGPNSSLPHAGITDRILAPGDLVVIDFGAVKDGYRSDMTRTVPLGRPGTRELRALNAVSGALEAALTAVSTGVHARDADLAARKHIEECGFGDKFPHGLGHGVGLEVHEKPSLSSKSPDTLEPGMVFTLEPGVYIEGQFGARIEEMVHLTPEGPVVLTDRVPVRPLSGDRSGDGSGKGPSKS
ncbi:MAG: aminopeptidase P family protein, partial [Actinobacteria bacterium]|nr:aminopeptidase P family protein [Actinomycetota bacterium]